MASPLRHLLIALSKNPILQDLIVGFPVSRRMARRFVAGERLEDAIAAIRDANERGIKATLDYLGENVLSETEATANGDEYIRALEAINETGVDSNVSIKLTAMGLAVDDDFCYRNVQRVVQRAAQFDNFIRIDMEDSPVTERTLVIYRRLRADYANVGIVLQSYLHRTQADVKALLAEGSAHVRLCKGAYDEPPEVAFQKKTEVDQNLKDLITLMLSSLKDHPGAFVAAASHDHTVINWTKAYAHHHQVPTDRFEFQMLLGIRRDLQQELADAGYRMRVYVPYGLSWYPYFMRRLAERPANLLFFLRALVGD